MAVTLGFLVCGRWRNIMQPSHLGDLFYEMRGGLSCFFWIFECGERALGWKSLYGALCWINPQVLGKRLSWESWSGLKKKQQNAIWKLRMHHWFWQWMSKFGVAKLTVRNTILWCQTLRLCCPKLLDLQEAQVGFVSLGSLSALGKCVVQTSWFPLPTINSLDNLKEVLSAAVQSTINSHW